MADSLCGPSNALQNFQKHSTVDRTLQQDRLISRQSPSQGFRSSPGSNAGHLESDFQAFQAGGLAPESQQSLQQAFPSSSHSQPGPAAWASDFQRMHISSPPHPPQFAQQPYHGQPQHRHDTGGWHQDFAKQFGTEQRVRAQTSHLTGAPTYGYSPMNGGMGMGLGMQPQFSGGMMGQQADQSMVHQQPAETFDEEAFARAFEEAAQEERTTNDVETRQDHDTSMTENAEASKSAMELGQDIMLEESAERFMSKSTEQQIPHQARLGADLIHDPRSESEPLEREDPDALARTAGQLLDSVRNNQSDKFQNSEFLGLMQLLRDKKVAVHGEKIVETSRGGGEYQNELLDLFHSLRKFVFGKNLNNDKQVRNLFNVLLQLNLAAGSSTQNGTKPSSFWDFQTKKSSGTGWMKPSFFFRARRLLQSVIDNPSLATLPALRNLAELTLLQFESIEESNSSWPAPPLSADLEAVRVANTEITAILPPTETAFETLIYNYISDSLQHTPLNFNQEHLNRLLGYEFTDSLGKEPYATSTHFPHIQRAREILGPAISETIDACRAFWCSSLSVENFFALVAAHQDHGGVKSQEYQKLLREVEGAVEEQLRNTIERARKLGDRLSSEAPLRALEAEGQLRFMQGARKHTNTRGR